MRKILALAVATGTIAFSSLSHGSPCDHRHFVIENHTHHNFTVSALQLLKGTMDIHTNDVIPAGSSRTWVLDSETGSHGNIKGIVTLSHDTESNDFIKLGYATTSWGFSALTVIPR